MISREFPPFQFHRHFPHILPFSTRSISGGVCMPWKCEYFGVFLGKLDSTTKFSRRFTRPLDSTLLYGDWQGESFRHNFLASGDRIGDEFVPVPISISSEDSSGKKILKI